jgi:hypothetical protein
MLSCEEFEHLFPLEHSPEVLEHKNLCPHCAQYSSALSSVRNLLSSLPVLQTPSGFEFRLARRIRDWEKAPLREWHITPKVLAFASGLALVLIAGVVYKNAQQIETQPITDTSPEVIVAPSAQTNQETTQPTNDIPQLVANEPDTNMASTTDSLKSLPLNPWEPRWDIEQVSVAP